MQVALVESSAPAEFVLAVVATPIASLVRAVPMVSVSLPQVARQALTANAVKLVLLVNVLSLARPPAIVPMVNSAKVVSALPIAKLTLSVEVVLLATPANV